MVFTCVCPQTSLTPVEQPVEFPQYRLDNNPHAHTNVDVFSGSDRSTAERYTCRNVSIMYGSHITSSPNCCKHLHILVLDPGRSQSLYITTLCIRWKKKKCAVGESRPTAGRASVEETPALDVPPTPVPATSRRHWSERVGRTSRTFFKTTRSPTGTAPFAFRSPFFRAF